MNEDLFDIDQSLLTEEILHSSPGILESVDRTFASTSAEGYGEWKKQVDSDNDQNTINDLKHVIDTPQTSLKNNDHEENLSAIDDIINRQRKPEIFPADRRNEIVHTDSQDAARENRAWYKFKWVNLGKKSHRITVIVSSIILMFVTFHFINIIPLGKNPEKSQSAAPSTAPFFTEPQRTNPRKEEPQAATSDNKTDKLIGITSATSRCTAGSNNPQPIINKKNPNDGNAWQCVTAYGVPGTVLRVYYDDWYIITNICLVPGWARINDDKSDEWFKHNTVSYVEYQFNDTEETRLEQDTKNYHGEVCTPVTPPVLASAMTITIRETATPTPLNTNTPRKQANGKPNQKENKDFAISSITITGHHAT